MTSILIAVVASNDFDLMSRLENVAVQSVIDLREGDPEPLRRAIRSAGFGYRRGLHDLATIGALGNCALLCSSRRQAEVWAAQLLARNHTVDELLSDGRRSPFQLPLGWA